MGMNKKYSGYESFSYLEPGKDFTTFEMIDGASPFESHLIPLTAAQEQRALELAEKTVMISLHEHPHLFPKDIEQTPEYEHDARVFTAYEALANSYWDAVFDNFMDGCAMITSKHGWKWSDIIYDHGMRFCDLAHQDLVIKCEGVDDIYRAHRDGQIALVVALEAATMIENELDRIEILYGFGVRQMGITYSESNMLGTGLRETRDGGLTSFCERYTDSFNRWWDDLGDPRLAPDVAAELIDGVAAEAGSRSPAQLSAERDAMLAAILRATAPIRSA